MIHVIATVKVDPAHRGAFLEGFHALAPLVHAEAGCLEYSAAIDEPTSIGAQVALGEGTVVIVEKWESVAALDAHLDAPHMHAWREKVGPIVRGVQLSVLRPA